MRRLHKTVMIICRVLEVFNVLAAASSLLGMIALLTGLTDAQLPFLHNLGITLNGVSLSLNPAENSLLPGTQGIVFAGAIIVSLLRALMFRSVALILRTAHEAGTPFLPHIVHLLRQVGMCAIAQPVIGLIIGLLTANHLRTELDFTSAFIGLMVLCLSTFFAQGAALQQDADNTV